MRDDDQKTAVAAAGCSDTTIETIVRVVDGSCRGHFTTTNDDADWRDESNGAMQ